MTTREQILKIKSENPKFGYKKIGKIIGKTPNSIRYHLSESFRKEKQEKNNERIRSYKRKLVEMFGGKCSQCDYSTCIEALEFHHLNMKEKEFNLFQSTHSLKKIIEESKKCILVCSNCHKEIHYDLKFNALSAK